MFLVTNFPNFGKIYN